MKQRVGKVLAYWWRNLTTCKLSRNLWSNIKSNKTRKILTLSRHKIAAVTEVLTVHFLVVRHTVQIGFRDSTM